MKSREKTQQVQRPCGGNELGTLKQLQEELYG